MLYTYYYWQAYNGYDGALVIFPEIEEVYTNCQKDGTFGEISVTLGSQNVCTILNPLFLFNTEKEALKRVLYIIRENIYLLNNGCEPAPKNPDLWLYKAIDYNEKLVNIYSSKYPELFI